MISRHLDMALDRVLVQRRSRIRRSGKDVGESAGPPFPRRQLAPGRSSPPVGPLEAVATSRENKRTPSTTFTEFDRMAETARSGQRFSG